MIHPDTYVKQTSTGLGVFAARKFVRGEILWISDDLDVKIPYSDYEKLPWQTKEKVSIYGYLDFDGRVVIAWDEGKLVNHSCSPNSTGLLQFDNVSVALRDIEQDEEILEDYYCYYGHFETFNCGCQAEKCRQIILNNNSYDPSLRLDLAEVGQLIASIPQYLLSINSKVNEEFIANFKRYLPQENWSNGFEEEIGWNLGSVGGLSINKIGAALTNTIKDLIDGTVEESKPEIVA
jgi:hypothetical protein